MRGVFGADLTAELVERIGRAFALWSGGRRVLIGSDTRASSPELAGALAAGLSSGGACALLGGVLPSAAVALLADELGAVVTASHNPAEYNGVKFFGPGGRKLGDAEEEEIEALLGADPREGGSVEEVEGLAERYADLLCERFGTPLEGLRIACDCANGALSAIAPGVLERLGAAVEPVAIAPDGANINDGCGATDLSLLSGVVRAGVFHLGVAFDGDGDRVLAVDADGREVDGDQVLAVLALHLGVELVVVTTMTNLGFHRLMAERGIRVVTTDVGDRYVLEALTREGGILGGEQSGHVIYLNGHTTGDGLAAALLLCSALVESAETLAGAVEVMTRWPQAKANVRVRSKELSLELVRKIEAINVALGDRGRVLVRPSGTEPVVRVLTEAENVEEAEGLCDTITDVVVRELG